MSRAYGTRTAFTQLPAHCLALEQSAALLGVFGIQSRYMLVQHRAACALIVAVFGVNSYV